MAYIPEAPGTYQGNQVIINSDRLLFNAKNDSILLFSDKAIGFSTNGSFHFDTSNSEESKFVVNSPKIYLGLEYDDTLPTQPAVLGEELKTILTEMLDTMEEITDKICVNVAYTIAEGPLTGLNPKNFSAFDDIRTQIDGLKIDLDDMMSINTKLV